MICTNPHRNVFILFTFSILRSCFLTEVFNHRLKYICIIVRLFALKNHAKSFKAHSGVYILFFQRHKTTICHTIVFHKHQIPNLDNQRIVFVHQILSVDFGFIFRTSQIDMYFRASAARTCFSHFPEIVFLAAEYDSVFRNPFFPIIIRLFVGLQSLFFISSEHGYINHILAYAVHFGQ